MPIAPEQIPVLITAARDNQLPRWKRDWFKNVAINLQVHTKGQLFTKVDTLFPNEHPDSKKHCVNTYEPITKGSIWKAINNLSRIFSNSSFTITTGDELKDWLEEYNHEGDNLLTHFIDLWFNKAVAEDPNGLFIVYPPDYAEQRGMCPLQFVRSDFIYSQGKLPDGTEYVAFTSEHDSEVKYFIDNTGIKREIFYDAKIGRMNGRDIITTTYNERIGVKVVKRVLHLITVEGLLIYQADFKKTTEYQLVNFAEPLSCLPIFVGGGNLTDKAPGPLFESFVSSFQPFGNLALLQHRNHRAVDLQFSYPRMAELQTPCDNPKCLDGHVTGKRTEENPTGLSKCTRCDGGGYVTVQSPYKSYSRRYDPSDGNNNEHLKVAPVEFFSPDVAIIDYSKDAWKDYLKMAEEAVFIMQRVQTGQVQSEESKRIDLNDLFAWLAGVSKTFYNNVRILLQVLEDYIDPTPSVVSVEKPYSYAILTEEEAFVALNNILMSASPVFIKGNQVEAFVSKFISKSSPVVKALGVLKQYDPLLYYATADVQVFKGAGTITQEMWTKHILAYPVLVRLYEQDHNLFEEDTEAIMTLLDAEIETYNVPSASSLRQSLLDQFQRTGGLPGPGDESASPEGESASA